MPRRSVGGYLGRHRFAIALGVLILVSEAILLTKFSVDPSDIGKASQEAGHEQKTSRNIPALRPAWVPIRARLIYALDINMSFIDRYHDTLNALSTLAVAIFTATLWRTTRRLFISGERQIEIARSSLVDIQRAFIFIDGFNTELTTADQIDSIDPSHLEESGYGDPSLFVSRFAVQPRWKNSGATAVRNMVVQVDWSNPLRPIPSDYEFRKEGIKFFVGPGAVEIGEVFEMPGVQAVINHANKLIGVEPIFLVWGRADYEDVFGSAHVTKWCYRVRFDRHDGKRLRAMFIQWGEHNSAD